LVIGCPTEPANLAPVRENSMFCYGPLVSELGGPRVNSAPQPRHWGGGAVPLRPPGSAAHGHSALGLDLEISCRVLIMSALLHASRGHTYDPGRQRMTRQDQQPR